MDLDLRIVLRNLGWMLHVPGLMALATLPVAWIGGEGPAVPVLLVTALASLVPAQALVWKLRDAGEIRQHHALKVAALSWLLVPLLGALPFVGLGYAGLPGAREFTQPWNALFESFSGFTGTGLTVVASPSALPATLQWWRSFSEWVGGIGVIMVMLSILRPTAGIYRMYFSEGREERIRPTVRGTARTIWWIFLGYTALAVLLFRLCGMQWWEALNHGMTGVSTGGFSITDDSFAGYPALLSLAAIPVMVIGAISFAIHDRVLRGRFGLLWSDGQHRYLLLLLAGGAAASLLEGRFGSSENAVGPLEAVFQWVSALATAGFQSASLSEWSPAHKLLLSIGMLIGGAMGSTVGGLKQIRLFMLVRGLLWRVRRLSLKPREIPRYEMDGRSLGEEEARAQVETAGVFAFVWFLTLACTVLVLLHVLPGDAALEDVLFEAASAQGNVGLSTGLTGAAMPWPAKLTLMASMYAGRLEIMPLLIFLVGPLGRLAERSR